MICRRDRMMQPQGFNNFGEDITPESSYSSTLN